ncbi:endonuclease domain-containing protein [Pedococcus sp. 5OH_020]|uniref:endonuclease domain-containing protein n=1 Tax=Pedococcus sp. 5OH_020 TaxID=2989814 RepID=UPI0022E9B1CB|nr:DUF559 domain-containing protein [Pedococcus sp. 5OH_020]
MPIPLQPLPAGFADRPFTLREARKAGVTQYQLEAADLVTPTWGMRSPDIPETVEDHATVVSLAIAGAFAFSHITAARLWELPLPSSWRMGEPLHVMRDSTPLRRAGVVGHRGLSGRRVHVLHGRPVTSPVDTWLDLGAMGTLSTHDLVVAGDALATRSVTLLPRLQEGARRRRGRGSRHLRQAADLLRAGSGSPMETRARLAFVDANLPEPELNASVYGDDAQFVARVDFLWREARVIVEYEGDQHRTDRQQWQKDIERVRVLEALGWRVVRITHADLTDERRRRALLERLHTLIG